MDEKIVQSRSPASGLGGLLNATSYADSSEYSTNLNPKQLYPVHKNPSSGNLFDYYKMYGGGGGARDSDKGSRS